MIKISDLNRHDLNQPILLMGSLMINSLHNHLFPGHSVYVHIFPLVCGPSAPATVGAAGLKHNTAKLEKNCGLDHENPRTLTAHCHR